MLQRAETALEEEEGHRVDEVVLGNALLDVHFGNDLFLPWVCEEVCLAIGAFGVKHSDRLIGNHFRHRLVNVLSGTHGSVAE